MFNDFKIFNNENLGKIKSIIDENGVAWFSGNDIALVLGYDASNTTHRVRSYADEEDIKVLKYKALSKNDEALRNKIWDKPNDFSDKLFVNEYGMYSMIMRSNKPDAKEFQKWITHEVVPSIRENGGYILNQEKLPEYEKPVLNEEIKKIAKSVYEKASKYEATKVKWKNSVQDRNRLKEVNREIRAENKVLESKVAKISERLGESDDIIDKNLDEIFRLSRQVKHLKDKIDELENPEEYNIKKEALVKEIESKGYLYSFDNTGLMFDNSGDLYHNEELDDIDEYDRE